MYPKLNPEPVWLNIGDREIEMPREKIAAAYAGAFAAWEMRASEGIDALTGYTPSFEDQYRRVLPSCITAANSVGKSATVDTLEYWHPGKGTRNFLLEKNLHPDNPFYPFFEET
jgi:hypothetical protein